MTLVGLPEVATRLVRTLHMIPKLFLQLKNESWEGEFVDINEVERIPNCAVIRAVVDDSKSEVNIFFTFNVMLTIKPCF